MNQTMTRMAKLRGSVENTPEKWIVAGLVALVMGVRIYLASFDRVVWGDEPFYLWLGRNWLAGQGYSFTGYSDVHHTPLYPLLTGLLGLITGNMELASSICYVVFGTLLVAYVLGFLLFFLPYAYYVSLHTGSWMVTEKAGVTFVTCIGLSTGDTAAFDKATWGLDTTGEEVFFFSHESYNVSMLDYVRQYPVEFTRLVYGNAWRFLSYLMSVRLFPSFLVPFLALGLFAAPWDKTRAKRELVWLASAVPVLAFILFFIQDRYIATLLPTLIVWAASGLHAWGQWFADTISEVRGRRMASGEKDARTARLWRKLCVALPIVLLLAFFVYRLPTTLRTTSSGSYRMAHKDVGLWLEDRVDRDTVIMSRYPAIAFHADARWVPTPNAEIPEVLHYARHKGAEYFVVDEREVVHLRPQFEALLREETLPRELEWVYADDAEGERLVVLRVK